MKDSSTGIGPSPEQLGLLPEYWRSAPRRWGHPLHSLCSYFAMFPPQIANVFISWLTNPGDVVYDPFSGRGTVALEALLLGRIGLASDANPLALALSRAKTSIPARQQLIDRLTDLESAARRSRRSVEHEPPEIRMLYSDCTLRQLVFLKHALEPCDAVDAFIIAMVLGMLHANHAKNGATRGFSISMPNTFAMAPGYVKRYIADHHLVRPEVDVFAMLRQRTERLDLPDQSVAVGTAWLHDATTTLDWPATQRAQLIFTSPPYLQVIKYGKYNWIRLWFLGEDPRAVDEQLMSSGSLPRYVEFITSVCQQLATAVSDDGFICLVIGDVRRGTDSINLAQAAWKQAIEPLGWHLHGVIADELPEGRKVSRIWKNNSGRATKVDRILLLSPSPTTLPPLTQSSWDRPRFRDEGTAA